MNMPGQLPHSMDTEQALLGSLIVYPDTIIKAYDENLSADDFYDAGNRRIYRAIMSLYEQKKPIDIVNVITWLNDTKELNGAGGAEYIASLTDMAISDANSSYYIKLIQDKATMRRVIEASEKIIEEGYEAKDLGDFLAETESRILAITRNIKTTDFVTSEQTMKEVIATIRKLQTSKDMSGIRSGFEDLDRITFGFQKGDLIILAARPSVGKTAFALNVAINAGLQYHHAVALFSLEMPYQSLGIRMLSANSKVNNNNIRTGQYLSNDDWARISASSERFQKARIYIDDSSSIKINDIFAKCRKLKAEGNLDLILIDYLQLITPSSRHADNRQQEVSEISRSLKSLAREMEVPVIALSQLSRSVEQRKGDKTPMLSDLRESGAIEQDADIVMFLHRPDYYNSEKNEENEERSLDTSVPVSVIIAKHRNGQIGRIELMFQPSTNAFYTKRDDIVE